jgi:hypothetical protein
MITTDELLKKDAMLGRLFGRLTPIRKLQAKEWHRPYGYECKCICGTTKYVTRGDLVTGHTVSCGCARIGRKAHPTWGTNPASTLIKTIKAESDLTQEKLNSLFSYTEGGLFWRDRPSTRIRAGSKAGSNRTGRYSIRINGKSYLEHRLIFMIHRGWLPEVVDHKDCNPANNHIENLRAATKAQNGYNTPKVRAKHGIKNVSLHRKTGLWNVRFMVGGVQRSFGYFKTIEEASQVAENTRDQLHGDFANHGVPC